MSRMSLIFKEPEMTTKKMLTTEVLPDYLLVISGNRCHTTTVHAKYMYNLWKLFGDCYQVTECSLAILSEDVSPLL